jgi:capsular polysaccharide biosynthesis protein
MTSHDTIQPTVNDEDEIDLIQLAKTLWKGRKTVIISVAISSVIGIAIALLSPNAFTVSTTMVPQVSSKQSSLGGLSSLAAMAGFNLDMGGGGGPLSPVIYPQIVGSVPFQLELMNTPFTFSEAEQKVTIFQYFTEISKPGVLSIVKKYTIGLPFVILKAIRGDRSAEGQKVAPSMLMLTKDQDNIRKFISQSISLDANSKEGYLTLSVTMPEALTAAEVATKAQEMLQRHITDFKIAKAADQLRFIEERYEEKKAEFEDSQQKLAAYRDRNKNVSSAVARTGEERLQSEYNIAFNVYNELAKQLEQARIQVKEDTPVLSIIKPVVVPVEKSQPKRAMILVIWVFLGGIVGVGIVFGKHYISTIREKWNSTD